MLSLKHLHLCDYAFLTHGGKLSLIGIFDKVLVRSVPAVIHPFHIVAILGSGGALKTELEVIILNPEDKVVFKGKGPVRADVGKNLNFLLGIAGFRVERPGTYIVRFIEKGNELARLEFPVLIVDQGGVKKRPLRKA